MKGLYRVDSVFETASWVNKHSQRSGCMDHLTMTDSKEEPAMEVDGTAFVIAGDSSTTDDMMSTLVSLHATADAFQLTEFNKALHKGAPGGRLARFFTKAERRGTVSLEEMLRHQLEPLPAPLLRSTASEARIKALKCFSLILRFSEDRCLTMDDALEAARKLLEIGHGHVDVRDECYMQLFKQTRGNSDPASRRQLWQLFHVLASTMPPSKDYISLLSHYVHEVAHDEEEDEDVRRKAMKTWNALKRSVRSGARKWLPSVEEIRALLMDRTLQTVIYFLDETCEEVKYDIATTVLEALEELAQIIGLEQCHSFSLYESHHTKEHEELFYLLDDQRYIADVLRDLAADPEDVGRLTFRKRMFRESDEHVTDPQFVNLSYIQVQYDYLHGFYPVVYEDAAQLCALQIFAEYGDLPGDERLIKKGLEKFTLRDVKRHKSREEWKGDVLLRCTTLKCPSAEMARYAFLSLLRSLPYGNSIFFCVARMDDPIGLLPPKVVLGVNNRGVHFFRPIPKEYLHSVELRDIMQFGSSNRAVFFKMRVAGVLHIFQFETKQGEDICMAIQTHINDIMVQRYATSPAAALNRHERSSRTHFEGKVEERLVELQRDIDQSIHEQEILIARQGNHIRERDRDVSALQDTIRQSKKLQREAAETAVQLSGLQTEILKLKSELNELHTATASSKEAPDVEQLVRYFDDTTVADLESAKDMERGLMSNLSHVRKERLELKTAICQFDGNRTKELQELNDALFDATNDGRSRLNLEDGRIASLREDVDLEKAQLSESQFEIAQLLKDREELMELKMLQSEVQERDAVHAQTIANQKHRIQRLEKLYKREQLSRKRYHNKIEDMKGKIRVYARIRSVLPQEEKQGQSFALHFPDDLTVSHLWKREDGLREYGFDGVFHPSATQKDVFNDTRDLIQSAVDGYNVCLFAYGQTGSGKTFTIYGNRSQPGLAPRSIEHLFQILERNSDRMRFHVSCYMLELYQDTLRDLLSSKTTGSSSDTSSPNLFGIDSRRRLEIKKEQNQLVRVHGATIVDVQSAEELIGTFEEGQRHRHVASTRLNIASSRSHLIMSVVIESTDLQTQAQTRGKLSFVDLAGSERNKKSGSTGEQLKEAQAINKSLSALGDVISSLARGDPYIPYRNHKLTMLMSDSLGGNAKTLMFVNVSPTDANLDETQNSLQYAMRVRTIKNEATKETDMDATALKRHLAFWKCMASATRCSDVQNMIEAFR